MATVTKKKITQARRYSGPQGNAFKQSARFVTNASGVFVDSDQATAVQINDKIRLAVLQAGLELQDALAIVSDAFAASTTLDLGFEYVDGVDSTSVPQDADYFFAALATSSVGRTRANNTAVAPVVLPKDAYLILTRKGAADSAVGIVDFVIEGVLNGPQG